VRVYLAHEHWLVCPTHVLWRHKRERCDARACVRCQLRHNRPPQLWRHTGLLERCARHIDVFVAMSEFSRAKHREFGFPYDMDVLPYFLPNRPAEPGGELRRPHARPYFLFVGRLERIKGLEDVLPVFARYEDADLVVVGDGDYGPQLRSLAGGNPRVRFVGRLPSDALHAYYQHALALLAPSQCFETFGITLIEAFSHCTPVIARRLGPFPEIVEGAGAGELFETNEELESAMRSLQSEPERRAALGRAGYRAYCERWSEDAIIPRYLALIDRVRARRQAGC
jgi:glycosyltransferase involved in cell wall biosynthesis